MSWFDMKARAGAGEISIFGEIGQNGITAAKFASHLNKLGQVSRITMSMNSPGGSVFDGLAIYNILRRHPARIFARIDGVAASIASTILMAADEIVAPENSLLMVHNPAGFCEGTASDMAKFAETLNQVAQSMGGIYAARSRRPLAEVLDWMNSETWFDGAEAVKAGLADRIEKPVKMAAHHDLSRFVNAPPQAITAPPPPPPPPRQPTAEELAMYERVQKDRNKVLAAIVGEAVAAKMPINSIQALLDCGTLDEARAKIGAATNGRSAANVIELNQHHGPN
jgi:ATP-dependent Clp protease, protease subunit